MIRLLWGTVALVLVSIALGTDATAGPPTEPPKTDPAKVELPKDVPSYLQDISVTIHAGRSQGSGTIKTRDGVNYVWTAGHVVDGLRTIREAIDPKTGNKKMVVSFDDAKIVKEMVEDGRSIGRVEMDAEVLRFSNADTGDDLALLRIRKKNFVKSSVIFYLEDKIPAIGTPLLHCGSLRGQFGSNSMTNGIMSQHGRVYQGIVYDQTTCTAFPGSSGGGVFLADGRFIGMLVRGSGETFNLVVPQRRLAKWAKKVGVEFAINDAVKCPAEDELKKHPVEDESSGGSFRASADAGRGPYQFMINRTDEPSKLLDLPLIVNPAGR
jgi:S1-C subfamily serine protease